MDFADYPLPLILAASIVAILGASEIGRRFGLLNSRRSRQNTVVIALYGLAIVASAFAGYAAGLDAQRARLPIYTIGVLVSIVIFLIQDLDRPGPGLITVSQQPMLDTATSIAAFTD